MTHIDKKRVFEELGKRNITFSNISTVEIVKRYIFHVHQIKISIYQISNLSFSGLSEHNRL